jgi:type II secretory pathway pseudopilin PulG
MRTIRRTKRSGYTLLELLLALGLTVIVIGAIGSAIQLYIVALTKQQAKIERKQIARSVIAMIANDLRAGIQYKAADYSSLENLVATQQMMIQGPPPSEEAGTEEEPADSGIIVEEEVSFRPTLIGTDNVIMMDISRLPRLDQYNPLVATAESLVQTPSDVKSLAYFVALNNGGIETQVDFGQPVAPGGLYRREIDRAVAAYMGDYDLISNPDAYTKLIASEIAQVSFRYFDGEDWQDEWDATENGGFPTAVEVTIVIDPERSAPGSQSYSYTGLDRNTMEAYRSVVHLPISDLPPSEE